MADMDDFADINRRLESLIRYGTVAEVKVKPPRVRVRVGKLNTEWIRWVALRAATTSDWCPPVPGEQCVLLSPSGDMATAVALMGLASDKYPLPSDNPDEWVRRFPDGAVVRYDHANSALTVSGIKTAIVQAAEHVTVDCPESTFTGNVRINGNLTVDGESLIGSLLTYMSGMEGKGDFNNRGRIISNGIELDTHTHRIDSGGSTGAPQ